MVMAAVTVKIPIEAHATLVDLARTSKRAMSDLLTELIEQERRRRFWQEFNVAFERLKADPEAWADYQEEFRSMEVTLMDGLRDEPPWLE